MIQDRMIYLVLVAHPGGAYMPERNETDLDRATTVKDIATAQLEGVTQVLECNPVEGTCRDVTEDIARDVMQVWADQAEPLAYWQRVFLESHIGVQATRAAFGREAA